MTNPITLKPEEESILSAIRHSGVHVLLSGSISLKAIGAISREHNDLDLVVNSLESFLALTNLLSTPEVECVSSYSEESVRYSYRSGAKVCVFYRPNLQRWGQVSLVGGYFNIVDPLVTIQAKIDLMKNVKSGSEIYTKHANDIVEYFSRRIDRKDFGVRTVVPDDLPF
jgi:hypothetical protein